MPPDRHGGTELLPLFPPLEPYKAGFLDLEAPHRMYYEESGNPKGVPVVFLHGGPGAGASAVHRQFFDPAFYRIVVYDQRGAGRSVPLGCLENNTTPKLIDDLERLRAHLGIDRWIVFGGSWGSTLALAYGEHHPQRCRALVLRGIFLCRPSEIDWFLYGLRAIFPEAWRTFSHFIPESERSDLLKAYHARLVNPEPAVHMPAARCWSVYEGSCSTLLPNPALVADFASDRVALGLARIEAHYFVNDIFLPPDFLLRETPRLKDIPGYIVQGRYDIVCPAISADDLHRAWPEAEYSIVADAGHSAFEPGIRSRLVAAMESLKARA
ncbi:MAG TPA: prolyl aminopeptidase [Usitatibacter sp.]|jgi:proline iminopeptidase|nr:prolyl aminopeptidase [Usitatibacter sp.]